MKKVFGIILFLIFAISCKTTTETLIIGPSKVPCTGVAPQDCLQVKKDSSGTWENFYGDIKGFDYEPGYEYTIKVDVTENKNAPADASSLNYTLKEVLTKKKVTAVSDSLSGTFDIITFEDQDVTDKKMTIKFNAETGQVYGKGVCNRFSGTFVTNKDKIKFSQAATTRMMCKEPELERDFFQKLNEVDRFELEGSQLMIMKGKTPVLTATLNKEEE